MAFLANERCLTCSKELDGRFDKIYCNDVCRATYHNRKKSVDQRYVRAVNKILLKNREVLKDLNEVKILQLKKDMLLMRGFNFDFYTQIKDLNNRTYKFCYEWGYKIAAIDEVEIVKLDESFFLPEKK